jgi:hypothetical protein
MREHPDFPGLLDAKPITAISPLQTGCQRPSLTGSTASRRFAFDF